MQPGAYIYIAAAALVTADKLAALRDTFCITRLPATYSACGRVMAEAVAHNHWEAVMVIKVGSQRQLARPLSTVQQPYLRALGVPAMYFTVPQRGYRPETGTSRSHKARS